MSDTAVKPVSWVGSSYKDFRALPDSVQDVMGYALYQAQIGDKHRNAKLKSPHPVVTLTALNSCNFT